MTYYLLLITMHVASIFNLLHAGYFFMLLLLTADFFQNLFLSFKEHYLRVKLFAKVIDALVYKQGAHS